MNRLTMTALAGALMLTSLGGAATQSRCYSEDAICRISELEGRVERLERQLDRGGRGAELTMNQSCAFDSCAELARRACEQAGFTRGVPTDVDFAQASWGTLTKATCYD